MKKLIGLTGRTGSGKSSAAKIFEELGVYCVDCDAVAHEILLEDEIKEKLVEAFSKDIFGADCEIDRKKLGAIVFSDSEKLKTLNTIMHGAIIKRCLEMCNSSGHDICLIDGSELESSGVDEKCDLVVVITADENVRLRRVLARDNISEEEARKRIRSQKDYSRDAIFIDNGGSEEALREKICALFNTIRG